MDLIAGLHPAVAWMLGGLAAVTVAGTAWRTVLGPSARRITQVVRRFDRFLDDWYGEDARDGRPARPSMTTRMSNVEHEVTFNGGSSLKDSVRRVERAVEKNTTTLHELSGNLREHMSEAAVRDRRLDALEGHGREAVAEYVRTVMGWEKEGRHDPPGAPPTSQQVRDFLDRPDSH
ncbi:hypothetical protein H9L10_03490 [Phycicoccus endophyticus]|uniref:Uncharacterized protein n=1 Tax=Phycicoccus endophyticus TaxID=1690220 RepID=A0A7G9R3F7_9MICO|nr:hypothetical protein [Phycicoccus endophyticus]NHI19888.1 hypothetical protein [Phycicoccus endophyticus]QNN50132.1 hypothetical protein H9L10_03490 [Phycicoccus endophyticus]GGL27751.1 hypothetical protein GCM10012283_07450 [Phycicoccus endophyticus]